MNFWKKRRNISEEDSAFKRLVALTEKLENKENDIVLHEKMIKNIADSINLAIWAKDVNNRFIYANKLCCDKMLYCEEKDIIGFTGLELELNLAVACNDSDAIVKKTGIPIRFIEINSNWWDTMKNPLFDDGVIVGTIGRSRNISNIIPQEIKDKYINSETIPIDINFDLCKHNIKKLFEIKK